MFGLALFHRAAPEQSSRRALENRKPSGAIAAVAAIRCDPRARASARLSRSKARPRAIEAVIASFPRSRDTGLSRGVPVLNIPSPAHRDDSLHAKRVSWSSR